MLVHRFFQPGCMYRVRVKTGDSNPHIERASPSFIDIQVLKFLAVIIFFALAREPVRRLSEKARWIKLVHVFSVSFLCYTRKYIESDY